MSLIGKHRLQLRGVPVHVVRRFSRGRPIRLRGKAGQTGRSWQRLMSPLSSSAASTGPSYMSFSTGKLVLAIVSGSIALFAGSCMYSLKNAKFSDAFTRYVPLASHVVGYLEEREYNRYLNAKEEFYKQQEKVAPYVSRTHVGNYEEAYANDGASEDPLAPELFFNPSSGRVGTEMKEYLPLITIPETNEPKITHLALCLNDLISSVNASAASSDTVLQVSRALEKLSSEIEKEYPEHAQEFKTEAEQFASLVSFYRDKNDQEDKERYHQQLSQGVLEVERHLVSHVNTRGHRPREKNADLSKMSDASKSSLTPGERLALVMEIQLALTMATSGVDSVRPYIDGARKALQEYALPVREQLVAEALKGVNKTDGVDLQAIVNQILEA